MLSEQTHPSLLSILTCSLLLTLAHSNPAPSVLGERENNPLHINWAPAPAPEDGPPFSAGALRDKAYLPAQIGGIVGAYALSLVLVAITLLSLAKKRREHLNAGNDGLEFELHDADGIYSPDFPPAAFETLNDLERVEVPNFSYPSPTKTEFNATGFYVHPSANFAVTAPGLDPSVDQSVVEADRAMAQQQLEDMYKLVMEQEEAKQRGITLDIPAAPGAYHQRASTSDKSSVRTTMSKKERTKPANLNLSAANEEKTQSRTSSLFSALRSPKKKPVKGISISSPIMTPQSATFPRHESQEMGAIPTRHYVPSSPPPIPTHHLPYRSGPNSPGGPNNPAMTPDISPQSVQSIDERLNTQLGPADYSRSMSQAPTEVDPESATSEHSQAPLVSHAPVSRPRTQLPSLPSSPKPGATFSRSNGPSAVRTGGSLPLRAYEPALASPSFVNQTTKQTVFERKGPLSPTTGRTPLTAGAVPYSPYQPFTPCMPMTPSLVTKDDRRRMKRMVPKTPTLQMVQSSDDMW